GSFHVAVNIKVFFAVNLAVNLHGFPDAGLAARTVRLRSLKGYAGQSCCLLFHWFYRFQRRSRRRSWHWCGSPFLATFVEDTHERADARRRSVSGAALAEYERWQAKGPAQALRHCQREFSASSMMSLVITMRDCPPGPPDARSLSVNFVATVGGQPTPA